MCLIDFLSPLTTSVLKEFPNLTQSVGSTIHLENETFSVAFANNTPQLINYTYNTAEWLGFQKTDQDHTLPQLVKWNIIYIVTVTLWAVVLVRQFNFRVSRGKPTTRPYFMFPNIKRSDADKNLKNCIKYLFNYGFYKFGIEVSYLRLNHFSFVNVLLVVVIHDSCNVDWLQNGCVFGVAFDLVVCYVCIEQKDFSKSVEFLSSVHCNFLAHSILYDCWPTTQFLHR